MEDQYHNRKYLKPFRRQLRRQSTPEEAILWKFLRNRQLAGKRFRRQHSFLNYILDFYCAEHKLAIELDGEGHFTPEGRENDAIRDIVLAAHNIRVLRFENYRVRDDLEGVLVEMLEYLQ